MRTPPCRGAVVALTLAAGLLPALVARAVSVSPPAPEPKLELQRGPQDVSPAAAPTDPRKIRLGSWISLRPHLQYRPRFEAHEGRDFAAGGSYEALSHRARLGLEAEIKTWLVLMAELQDVRLWGEELDTVGDYRADGFDLHQGWLELLLPHGIRARVGRQELMLDNQRLVGVVNWTQQGRTFDGVQVTVSPVEWLEARLLYAKVAEADALVEEDRGAAEPAVVRGARADADLAGLWVRHRAWRYFRPSLFALYDHRGAQDLHRATLGLYVDSKRLAGLAYTLEYYHQVGVRTATGRDQDISAFLAAARLSYRLPLPLRTTLTGWLEVISGDDPGEQGAYGAFDTLFATNHQFYGYMDLFLNIPAHTDDLGLMDAGGRVEVSPIYWLTGWVDLHYFELAEEHPSGARTLGLEIDGVLDVRLNKYLGLQGGLAVFVPDRALTEVRGGQEQTEVGGYLQMDAKF